MKRFLLWCLILAAFALPIFAAACYVQAECDETYQCEALVGDLPQDAGKWYLSIFGGDDHQTNCMRQWLTAYPPLRKLRAQTHYHFIATDSPMYTDRYAASTIVTPCLRLQDGERVVYESAGPDVPHTPQKLTQAIATQIRSYRQQKCPDGRCIFRDRPRTLPQQDSEPLPQREFTDEPSVPVVEPEPVANNDGVPLWLYVLCGATALAIGARKWWKREYGDK